MWIPERWFRLWMPTVAAVFSLTLASSSSLATTIGYDGATDRPTLFEGVGVDWGDGGGTLYYDVIVTWNVTFASLFGVDESSFLLDSRLIAWGNLGNANDAITALQDALVNDGFVSTPSTSYLDVPYELATAGGAPFVRGRGFNLYSGAASAIINVDTGRWSNNNTVGFTQWELSSVPEPSTALLLGLGLIGLAARRSR